jgi:HEAT repeat protein
MTLVLPKSVPAVDPIPELLRQLRHRLASTRLAAVKSLAKLGWQSGETATGLSTTLNDEDELVREGAAQAIGQLGPPAVPFIARMLANRDKYVRRHAVWALGKLGAHSVSALPDLCRALKDADPRTATGAAQALGEMGTKGSPAIADLAEAMRGTNVVLCRLAAKALSQIGKPALPILLTHLAHHDPFVKGEAAIAVGWIGPGASVAIPSLVNILRLASPPSTTPPVLDPTSEGIPPNAVDAARACAATALGRMGSEAEAALPTLRQFENDPCSVVQSACQQAIRLIRGSKTL